MRTVSPVTTGNRVDDLDEATQIRRITNSDLAWRLVEAVDSDLDNVNRTSVYVELGCGDDISAIHRVLTVAVRSHLALPESLLRMTDQWLDRYCGLSVEPPATQPRSKNHSDPE